MTAQIATSPMYPAKAPTAQEIAAARDVLRSARLAMMRDRRRARRLGLPAKQERVYPVAAFRCAWCGTDFVSRVSKRPVIGRWCSASCRQLGYQRRKQLAAKREAARAKVLAEMT